MKSNVDTMSSDKISRRRRQAIPRGEVSFSFTSRDYVQQIGTGFAFLLYAAMGRHNPEQERQDKSAGKSASGAVLLVPNVPSIISEAAPLSEEFGNQQ